MSSWCCTVRGEIFEQQCRCVKGSHSRQSSTDLILTSDENESPSVTDSVSDTTCDYVIARSLTIPNPLRCLMLISNTSSLNVFSMKVRSRAKFFTASLNPASVDPYFRMMNVLGTLPAPPEPPSAAATNPSRLPAILRLERTPFPSTFPPELASGLEDTKVLGVSNIVSKKPIRNTLPHSLAEIVHLVFMIC